MCTYAGGRIKDNGQNNQKAQMKLTLDSLKQGVAIK